MAVAAPVGKAILPGGRNFLLFPRSSPGSGGEERSDEAPEPGVGTWFAGPARFNEMARAWRKVVHRVPRREWAHQKLVGAAGSCEQLSGDGRWRLERLRPSQSGDKLAELSVSAHPPEAALCPQQGHSHPT